MKVKNKDGSWYQCVTEGNIIHYTDSDGVWMKETYDKKGRITDRLNSYGAWDKFSYKKDLVKKKEVLFEHTKGEHNA
jgi:YD repeat-containing protein